ncbi:hypothetical protein J6590_024988 [Homalodisca vitripennis]|nr:hypothetical protein J6590_024988 [Homalodisca vitripennis]
MFIIRHCHQLQNPELSYRLIPHDSQRVGYRLVSEINNSTRLSHNKAGGDPYLASEEVPVTERRPPSGSNSPTLPAHYRHASPSRQASPYPIESTNLTSGTSTPVNPSLSPRFASRPTTYKKPPSLNPSKSSTGTIGSRRKQHVTSSSSMTSSASSDNCCQSDVTYPEVEGRDRRKDLVEGKIR